MRKWIPGASHIVSFALQTYIIDTNPLQILYEYIPYTEYIIRGKDGQFR